MSQSRSKKSSASARGAAAAKDAPEQNMPPTANPTAAGGGRKRPSPVRPSGKVRQTDHTNETMCTKCIAGLAVLDVKKASGEPAFKAHVVDAIVKGKEGAEELGAIGVFGHKEERTADSKMVCVGKKGDIPDKAVAVYYEEGVNEDEEIQGLLGTLAKTFENFTKPFKLGGPKSKARAGKIVNPDDPYHADEVLANEDVATIITVLYPDAMKDGMFDDDEATADLLGDYFSLISIEEAKEIVLAAYAKES